MEASVLLYGYGMVMGMGMNRGRGRGRRMGMGRTVCRDVVKARVSESCLPLGQQGAGHIQALVAQQNLLLQGEGELTTTKILLVLTLFLPFWARHHLSQPLPTFLGPSPSITTSSKLFLMYSAASTTTIYLSSTLILTLSFYPSSSSSRHDNKLRPK